MSDWYYVSNELDTAQSSKRSANLLKPQWKYNTTLPILLLMGKHKTTWCYCLR